MNILIVDDESLARQRLAMLLQEQTAVPCRVFEAAAASQAQQIMQRMQEHACIDLVLLDVNMPGMDGMAFAQLLRRMQPQPAVVFVTAHAEFAAQAFELEALDYLTKPVRLERLRQTLERVQRWQQMQQPQQAAMAPQAGAPAGPAAAEGPAPGLPAASGPFIYINERGHSERVLLEHIIFCRAEMKYVTLHTRQRDYLCVDSLNDLEKRFPEYLLRVHRNALVARKALRALHKVHSKEDGDHWRVQLHGTDETLQVSRRMVAGVREALRT
ncbi:LytTR family DNA-binding domain-containing protein [Vandammella animalimorsus]|uniref:LytR/AlgR family response regulator transcription factor n=1 Tax=Vandammella animalimorsus TaxID=2029117 RepID=UPI000F603161|nr:DNA-binding response regulator [Comamonadaceae bacterium OH2310_COT-174]